MERESRGSIPIPVRTTPSIMAMIHYKDTVAQHGGDPSRLLSFDDASDQLNLLPYATLTAARATGELPALIAVYEWQSAPLFMLVNGDALDEDPGSLTRLRRLIAMRGDAPYLAVIRMGRLTFHNVGLDDERGDATKAISDENDHVGMYIPYLANNRPGLGSKQRWISDVILKLLTDALDTLVALGIGDRDAISFVGRALFTRFLADRNLLVDQVIKMGPSGEASLFDTPDSSARVSAWLDKTFNGDFLPLSEVTIAAFPQEAFQTVGNIMRRA